MERVIFKCERCGREYDISKNAMDARIKNKNFVCRNCHTSDSIRNHWKNMTSEKKERRSNNLSKKLKEYYGSLSNEEMQKFRQKRVDYYKKLSEEEKNLWKQKQRNGWKNMPADKKAAFIKSIQNYYTNMSNEDHDKFVKLHKDGWANKPKEEILQFAELKRAQYQALPEEIKNENRERSRKNWDNVKDKVHDGYSYWRNNLSTEELKEISDRTKRMWDNMTSKEREEFIKRRHAWYDKLSDDEKLEFALKSHAWRNKLNETELAEFNNKVSVGLKEYWENLSDEERDIRRNKIKDVWNNMSEEDRMNRSIKLSRTRKNMWDSLTQQQKDSIIQNNGIGKKVSGLNAKFELYCKESGLSDIYTLIPEYVMSNRGVTHRWDFALVDKDNKLTMLIDTDGAFFHADICDYDGIRSKLYYDTTRALTIPNGVLHIIMLENNFDRCFEELLNIIKMTMDEYINYTFMMLRLIPFPAPCYRPIELLRSYDRLQRLQFNRNYFKIIENDTRLGDMLIYHFHPSMWLNHIDGKISPYDAWGNDDILRSMIRNHTISQTYLNPNKILQGFQIDETAPFDQFISSAQWKLIMMKHNISSVYNIYGDPSILLASISLGEMCNGVYDDDTLAMVVFLKKYVDVPVLSTEPVGTIVAHVKNDNEMQSILNKFPGSKYLIVLDSTDTDAEMFSIKRYYQQTYYVVTNNDSGE